MTAQRENESLPSMTKDTESPGPLIKCENRVTFFSMMTDFASKNPGLVTMFFAFMLVQPLRDVVLPHLLGKTYESARKNQKIDKMLYAVVGLIVVLQVLWTLSDVLDIWLTPEMERHVWMTTMSHIFKMSGMSLNEVDSTGIMLRVSKMPGAALALFSAAKWEIIPFIVSCVGAFVYLVIKEPILATGFFLAVTVAIVSVYLTLRRCVGMSDRCQDRRSEFIGRMDDVLVNMRSVIGLRTENDEMQLMDHDYHASRMSCSAAFRCTLTARYIVMPVMLVALLMGARYSIIRVRNGQMNPGDFVSYLLVAFFVNNSIFKLTDVLEDVVHKYSVIRDALSIFETCGEVNEGQKEKRKEEEERGGGGGGGVDIRNVSYSHVVRIDTNKRDNPPKFMKKRIFNDLTLSIPPNRITVIRGGVGTGKSTLIDIILGHRRPDYGHVTIHGNQVSHEKNVFYIPQMPLLFDRTVYENLTYGISRISKSHVKRVIAHFEKTTGIPLWSGFFAKLQNGLDTRVGLHGSQLSGGQRQMIWTTKMLFLHQDVRLVVMDEPTASVDSGTRRIIFDIIRKASSNRTILIVTHDPLLSDLADETIQLENFLHSVSNKTGYAAEPME